MGGVSAGANLAAACARYAQTTETLACPLTGQWLNVPWLMSEQQVPAKWAHLHTSRQQNEEAPILPTADLEKVIQYTGLDLESPWFSPLNHSHPMGGLPKAYIQADGMDPLRDDAFLYDEMLREAGVQTLCDLYSGVPHAHTAFMADTEIAKTGVLDLMVAMGWMLGCDISRDDVERALDV